MKRLSATGVLIYSMMVAGTAHATDLTVPNTFVSGTAATAASVNANFDATETAVNSKQNRVTGACSTGYSIRAINADGSVTCEYDDNSGGDITAVYAGSGLIGGGTSGAPTISIGTGTVTATHLGSDSVAASEIVNGSIYDWELADEAGIDFSSATSTGVLAICDSTTDFTFRTVSVTAPTSGYIMVTAAGKVGNYATSGHVFTSLDDSPLGSYGDNYNYDYHYNNVDGNYQPYSYQNVYYVSAPGTYTYYLKACESAAINSYIYARPMIATFFPTRY